MPTYSDRSDWSEIRTIEPQEESYGLSQATVCAISAAMLNAVANQQNVNTTAQAATVMGVATLYSIDTASMGRATQATPPVKGLEAHGDRSEIQTNEPQEETYGLSQATVCAMSTAMQNAVANQQNVNITAQAATVMSITTLYSIDTASTGSQRQIFWVHDQSSNHSLMDESPAYRKFRVEMSGMPTNRELRRCPMLLD